MEPQMLKGKVAIITGVIINISSVNGTRPFCGASYCSTKGGLNAFTKYVYFPGPECQPEDQANACLYLASDMGKAVRGQILQVCNGAFL